MVVRRMLDISSVVHGLSYVFHSCMSAIAKFELGDWLSYVGVICTLTWNFIAYLAYHEFQVWDGIILRWARFQSAHMDLLL
jgi:hypothetical protein